LPFVLAQQQSESLELQLEPTSPPPARPPPVVQRAVAVQPSLRESLAKRQRALVSSPGAQPLAWSQQEQLLAEPEPLLLPFFV
jgi:hypothetical protein